LFIHTFKKFIFSWLIVATAAALDNMSWDFVIIHICWDFILFFGLGQSFVVVFVLWNNLGLGWKYG